MSLVHGTIDLARPARRARSRRLLLDSPWLTIPALLLVAATFVAPLCVILWYSLHGFAYGEATPGITAANYLRILGNSTYYSTLLHSIGFVAAVSALVTAVAFPFAYFVAVHVEPRRRGRFLVLAGVPFLVSYLARVIAWLNLLGEQGILNSALADLGLISEPLSLFNLGRPAVVITFVYLLAPLAFLTVYAALERIDPNLLDAASDLGARRRHVLLRIVLPAARNGFLGSFALVYVTLFGDYITPVMIGGTDGVLFVNLLVNQFGASMQWGFGSAMAVTMLVTTLAVLSILKGVGGRAATGEFTRRAARPAGAPLKLYAGVFLAFLYAPIGLLLLFALNTSERVGLPFTGLTLKWFGQAVADPGFRLALATSFQIAIVSSLLATAMGALAALSIARRKGVWRNAGLIVLSAPMLMPPVVLGTGILITVDAIGWSRGMWTLIAGHTLLSLPVAFLVVLSRLEGIDGNQELAAMDLGATPVRALKRVTLPQSTPALVSALLLTFAFSLDEFILTFLVTGKDTTLPLYIYGSIRFQLSPSVIAGVSIVLILSILLILLGALAYSITGTSARLSRQEPADARHA